MLAIDPDTMLGRSALLERMGRFCAAIRASPMWDDTARMLIPGELENEVMQRRAAEGLPLPRSLRGDLTDIAARLGCAMPKTAPARSAAWVVSRSHAAPSGSRRR